MYTIPFAIRIKYPLSICVAAKTLQTNPNSLYSAFDLFPSRKGAAIHIDKFARALFEEMDGGLLYVLGNESISTHQIEDKIEKTKTDSADRPVEPVRMNKVTVQDA